MADWVQQPSASSGQPAVKRDLSINHVRQEASLTEERHHLLAGPCHFIPSSLRGCLDCVFFEEWTDRNWGTLVKENEHQRLTADERVSSRLRAANSITALIWSSIQPFEPIHNVIDVGARFQIFKDVGDRHEGSAKYPGAAYLSRYAFDHGAL